LIGAGRLAIPNGGQLDGPCPSMSKEG
jgi:hypothetical protein